VGIALILCHFAIPFLVLLSRSVKRQPVALARLAIGILVIRVVDLLWLTAPEFHLRFSISWLDVLLPLSLGAIWLGCFAWQLQAARFWPSTIPSSTKRSARRRTRHERPAEP